ncbi:hypothetical protein ACWDSJ_16950 [Nocardia sp. NPDC003482]
MTYPPGSGPYGQDQSGWGGPQEQPAWGQSGGYQQPGWDQQNPGYAGGGYPPPPPPKNNNGLIVGIVIATIAVLVLGIGAVVLINNSKHSDDNHATGTTTPDLVTATDTSVGKTTPKSSTPAPAADKFSYKEQAKDWNFKLGDVSLHADWVEGRDDATCADIEVNGKLTGLGCKYAAEMIYRSERGGLMLTQYVLGMSSADKASAAIGQYTDEDLKPRPGTYIDNFSVGKWKDDSEKEFLVITLVTTTPAVTEDTATKYLRYLHEDMLGALSFR